MSVRATETFDAALRDAIVAGVERTRWRALRERVESFLAAGDFSYERSFLFVRPAIAFLIAMAAIIPRDLPGCEGVVAACGAALIYNFYIAYLVFAKRMYLLRASSILLDNLAVLSGALYVFRAMGHAGYESDLWLVFLMLIVTNGLYYGPIGSTLFAALWTGMLVGTTIGFYDVDSYSRSALPVRFTFFVLTTFVAISLSAELRQRSRRLERQSRQTLSMLATIVEARDSDAGQHLRRITYFSRALALNMGYDEKTANEIAYAAMIHDVGKAQVADAILKKPGPLTAAERQEIEKHTIWGHDLLAENDEFTEACEVARSHHERWDGSGYPDGLAAERIPLSARITAVADVYDALISKRPYKDAWTARDAIEEIRRLSGTHFDPRVVESFTELYDSGVLHAIDAEMREEIARDRREDLAA